MEAIHRLSRGDARGLGFTIDDEAVGLWHGRDLLGLSVAGSSAVRKVAHSDWPPQFTAHYARAPRAARRGAEPRRARPAPPPPPPAPADTAPLVTLATTDRHGLALGWGSVPDVAAPGGLARAGPILETARPH